MKLYALSDIHGRTFSLQQFIDLGFDLDNPQHHIVFLGDYFDRYDDNYGVYLELKRIQKLLQDRCHLIVGNHDGYMIEFDSQTIGYLLLSKTYSNEEGGYVTWVEEVYINDKYQGKGYGEITMKDIYQQFKDETKVFRLEVSPENKAIIDFYKRHGYEERVYLQMYHPNEEN